MYGSKNDIVEGGSVDEVLKAPFADIDDKKPMTVGQSDGLGSHAVIRT